MALVALQDADQKKAPFCFLGLPLQLKCRFPIQNVILMEMIQQKVTQSLTSYLHKTKAIQADFGLKSNLSMELFGF